MVTSVSPTAMRLAETPRNSRKCYLILQCKTRPRFQVTGTSEHIGIRRERIKYYVPGTPGTPRSGRQAFVYRVVARGKRAFDLLAGLRRILSEFWNRVGVIADHNDLTRCASHQILHLLRGDDVLMIRKTGEWHDFRLFGRVVGGFFFLFLCLAAALTPVLAETDWPAVLEAAAPAVVIVEAELDEGFAQGSGAIISSNGYVLTAQHVIEDAKGIKVYVPEGDGVRAYEASVVESSEDADIAVLKISGSELPCLPIGDSDHLSLEEEIRLLGYPRQGDVGVGLIIGRGVYLGSREPLDLEGIKLLQIDISPFDHGHSGGPVINSAGEIVGVAVMFQRFWPEGQEAFAVTHKLAVTINTAKQFIPSVVFSPGSTSVSLPGFSRGTAPSTWEIFGFSHKHLFIIPGNPAVGYPIPMPRPLPVEWAGGVIVGPDGLFYCTDVDSGEIVSFDPDTRTPTVIFESGNLHPVDLAFDHEGNLIFSTYAKDGANAGDSQGIWRIPGAVPGASAEEIISGSDIRECGVVKSGCRFGPPHVTALTVGAHRGDLLVSGIGSVAIVRAIGPNYTTLVPFIQATGETYSSNEPGVPDILSDFHQIPATGVIVATDFISGRILQFDPEGRYIGVLCNLYRANRVTSDYAGNIYASASVWGGRDLQCIVGVNPEGERLFELPINDVMGVVIHEE